MSTYTFKEPFLLSSEKTVEIFDSNNSKIGSIARRYDNKLQRIISLRMGRLYFTYCFYNNKGNRISSIKNIKERKADYVKARWLYETDSYSRSVSNKTKIKTNLHYQIETRNDSVVEVTRDFGERIVNFSFQNELIASIKHTSSVPRKVTVNIINDNIIENDLIFLMYFVYRLHQF